MASIRSSAPIVHSVHFYDHDAALIARLSNIITSAIETGNSVLAVATEEHRRDLTKSLEKRINDLQTLKSGGRLNFLDADETLSLFMVNGLPDRGLFAKSVGDLVGQAKLTAWNGHSGLTVFGEMVALLWERGNSSAALELEELWNEMLNDRAFHLHCAYPKSLFSHSDGRNLVAAICDGHTHVIGQAA
jgi:hypothetical protein